MTSANITPPKLGDVNEYTRIERVPIFTTHVRKLPHPETGEIVTTKVDADQLRVICDNTNKRINKGEYPLITIGHRDFKKPETEQPPLVGYLGENQIGDYNGEPAILADLYVMNNRKNEFMTYPRRSAEVFSKESPNGYIDSVAVLRRVPALDLGYITHFEKQGIEIFECVGCAADKGEEMADADNDGVKDEADTDDDNDGVKDSADTSDDNEIDEEQEGEGDGSEAVEKLAVAIASHVATSLSTNEEFLKRVGESASASFASSPEAMDAMIKRVGELLDTDKQSGQSDQNPSTNQRNSDMSDANKDKENFEKAPGEQELLVRLGATEVKLEKSQEAYDKLLERFEALESELNSTKAENVRISRRKRLEEIGVQDVDAKLEKFSSFNDEQFEMFAAELETTNQVPLNNQKIKTAHKSGKPEPLPNPEVENFENELTPEEFSSNAVITYAKEHDIDIHAEDGGVKAVREYLKNADRSKFGITKKK